MGGWYGHLAFSSHIPDRHRRKHINWKEAYAILYALALWADKLNGTRIIFMCDNSAIVNSLEKQTIRGDVRNGRNGRARTRRTGHGEGTLGAEQAQQAGIMRSEIGFTVAKTMEARRSVCREEFSP